ncbi:hypothetical protein HBH96_206820 [Parastagonospora nodorum]|nr:hypothetical protein HBH96_206820 [Parastagonospora nodorum]
MSDAVFEIATLPLRADADLKSSEDKQTWNDTLTTIAKQHSCKTIYWGLKIEDPTTLIMAIRWTSISHHTAFEESSIYPSFLQRVGTLLAGPPSIFHAKLGEKEGLDAFDAPITECARVFFPADFDQDVVMENQWSAFVRDIVERTEGMTGGFSIEPQEHATLGEGVEGKMVAAFVGWPSLEAHGAWSQSEEYGKAVAPVVEGSTGMDVGHVEFVKVERGGMGG